MADEATIEQEERLTRLQEQIHSANVLIETRGDVAELAKILAGKLNKIINEGHDILGFSIAISLAILKDAVDILQLSIPTPLTIGLSVFLVFFLWGRGLLFRSRTKILIGIIYFILMLFVDNLLAFSLLPINTMIVAWAWHSARKKTRIAEERLNKLEEATKTELKDIEDELSETETAYA